MKANAVTGIVTVELHGPTHRLLAQLNTYEILTEILKCSLKILGKSFDCFFFLAISCVLLLLLSKRFPSRSRSEFSCVEEWCQTNANLVSRVLALFGILQ